MRIALTVEALTPHLSGIGRYVWELTQRIGADPSVEDVAFYRAGAWIDQPGNLLIEGAPKVPRPLIRTPRWMKHWQQRRIASDRLFHGPNYFLPDGVERGVVTIHDLSVFRFPETHPAARLQHFERAFASTIARATHIITDSATVRDEVIAYTGVSADSVTAVPLGVAPAFREYSSEALAPLLHDSGLMAGEYALCVSTLEPRKKIAELLHAWRALPGDIRRHWPLAVAGGAGWLSDDLRTAMAQGEREGWVRYLGYVEEAKLPALYAGAALFVYPSIYEGFGLPPVEAMACGVPVIVSNGSCLPEITQGAALLVDPDDQAAFTRALEQGLTDNHWRSQARRAGLGVAASYRWERCASETVAIYKTVLR